MRVAFALAALLLPFTPIAAQENDYAAQIDTFDLFTRCAKMDLLVTVQDTKNNLPRLTELSVERAVRSRLRAAQLYDEESFSYLYVSVLIVDRASSISVELRRRVAVGEVVDMRWDRVARAGVAAAIAAETLGHVMRIGMATTWRSSSMGVNLDAGDLRDSVAQLLDEFIDEYLRVNDDACP